MRRSDSEEIEEALEVAPQEAVRLCEALLDEDDGDPDVWAYLAEARREAGDDLGALEAWAAVVERDPAWVGACTARAEILLDRGEHARAEVEIAVAREMEDDDARVWRIRALAAELRGHLPEAEGLYRGAAERDPLGGAPARLHRAELERALARRLAGRGLRAVLRELPSSPPLLRQADLDGTKLTIFVRNIERELDETAEPQDAIELVEQWLSLSSEPLAGGAG